MGKKGGQFEEFYTKNYSRKFKIDRLFFKGQTELQSVHCFSNDFLGKALFLDGKIQSAQVDEFIYHEALVQPAMVTHPSPQDVLVIGGGEGATLREVLRHSSVRRVTMVDIDRQLIDICETFMPEWSEGAFSDSRTELIFSDAREFLSTGFNKFDVVISDLTEPQKESPSVYLFTKEFFIEVERSLKEDGLFVLQAGSTDPFDCQFYAACAKTLETIYEVVCPYWTSVPSFALPWGFILASKKYSPLSLDADVVAERMEGRNVQALKFYHQDLHHALFSLPLYLGKALERGRILTDEKPFIWED